MIDHSQPIIIEDENSVKQSDSPLIKMLDSLQAYDSLQYSISKKYSEAMVNLSSFKFANEHTSCTWQAHRCVPAFLKLNAQNQMQFGYDQNGFCNSITQQEADQDEYVDQEAVVERNRIKMSEYTERIKNLGESQAEKIKEEQLQYRFGLAMKVKEVRQVGKQFESLLQNCLRLAEMKQKILASLKHS